MDSSEFGIGDRQSPAPAQGEEEKRGGLVNNRSTGAGGGGNQRTNFMGKHRMAAAIAHLNQQIQIIQVLLFLFFLFFVARYMLYCCRIRDACVHFFFVASISSNLKQKNIILKVVGLLGF